MLGYTGTRLCHVSEDLIGGKGDREPITRVSTRAGENPSEQLWQWSILFDLAILGWLPPTADISKFTEIIYSLHARVVLETLSSSLPNQMSAQILTVVVTLLAQ